MRVCGIFAIELVKQNGALGTVVLAGAADLAMKDAAKTGSALEDVLLLVVDVKEVKLTGARGEGFCGMLEEAAEDGRAEGVEEEADGGAGWKANLRGVSERDGDGYDGAAGVAPEGEIAASDADEGGMEFDAADTAERNRRGEQKRTAHACANVEEGELVEWCSGAGALPADEELHEDGRRDAVVGGGVPVVHVSGAEIAPGNESAGANAVGCVKRMLEEAGGFGEAG